MNEKTLKVLHVNDCSQVGYNLVQGLNNLGIMADIHYPTIGTVTASRKKRMLLPLTRTLESIRLRKEFRRSGYKILHVHYATFAYMALLSGLPFYLHCHGADLHRDLYRHGLGPLVRLGLKKAIKVFYSTPNLRQYLKGLRDDAIFLPNPLTLDDFQPDRQTDKSAAGIFVISKLDISKGTAENIETIQRVWAERPDTPVTMFKFGKAPDVAQSFFQENERNPFLHLIDRVPHDQMARLMRAHAVILGQQAPWVGAIGMTELEAMSCGRPLVSYFRYPDAYPEPPPIFSSNEPATASAYLIKLLSEPTLRSEMGQRARAWVEQYHDYRNVSRSLATHYGWKESK